MNDLRQKLRSGGSLRYRPPHGFYVVSIGKSTPILDSVARQAITTGLVRPAGVDQHGVYLFTISHR